ncbi:hypothetical protein TRVL_04563 [Trypanosoma vivax]|uniref:Uncharacterized protein n=1 Tax=Trypanosoma vivax (strain Y486) TaxID=1055687 RepID=G0TSC1_TRYVY|nr:hypothetical protein TRVL_04563 [Trypanosoma vivax]CCC46847.1 conserved hypothetical protein [Trypanosoma vivax Y486]
MDLSPFMRSETERPDVSTSSGSLVFTSDPDVRVNEGQSFSRSVSTDKIGKGAGKSSLKVGGVSCADEWSEVPPLNSSRLCGEVPAPARTPRVPVEAQSNDVARHEGNTAQANYALTMQQLEKTRQLCHRLNHHNDEMEGAFVAVRARLDSFRAFLALRLRGAVQNMRAELYVLRETVVFLMQEFAGDMEHCNQLVMEHLLHGISSGFCPSPFQGTSNEVGWSALSNARNNILRRHDTFRKVQDECEMLRRRLRQQRTDYEKHLHSMKEMYKQKENTLRERIKLLERMVGSEVSKLHQPLYDSGSGEGNDVQPSADGEGSDYNSGSDQCDSQLDREPVEDPRGKWRQRYSYTNDPVDERRRHMSLHHDVERRVRAQMLYGRHNGPRRQAARSRSNERLPHGVSSPRMDDRLLHDGADRLLSAVSKAYVSRGHRDSDWQGHLTSSAADFGTVVNGLWAEKMLQQRGAWRV